MKRDTARTSMTKPGSPRTPLSGVAAAGVVRCALVGVAASLAACGTQPQASTPDPRLPNDLASHMSEHFIASVDLETAVIRGQLREGQRHAAWIAAHEPHPELRGANGPYVAAVRAAAARASDAADLPALAEAAADMATACGGCHSNTGAGPSQLLGAPPDDDDSIASRMARHVWAADRLWESLLNRSDEIWVLGADVLNQAALAAGEEPLDAAAAGDLTPHTQRLAEVAQRAQVTQEWNDRAGVVGDLLATCSGCHGVLGIDPLGRAGIGEEFDR